MTANGLKSKPGAGAGPRRWPARGRAGRKIFLAEEFAEDLVASLPGFAFAVRAMAACFDEAQGGLRQHCAGTFDFSGLGSRVLPAVHEGHWHLQLG